MASVAAVLFAAPAQKKQPPARSLRVRLTDGSVFTAPSIEVRDESLTLILADKRRRQAPLTGVVLIEQMNGPVSWLSTRPPDLIEQIAFLEENFPPRMDRTVEDKPIRFGKTNYARGIGVHSHSILAWDLDGGYEAFRTQYAIDEGRNEKANVTVRIKLDDWPPHHEVRRFVRILESGPRPIVLHGKDGVDRSGWGAGVAARLKKPFSVVRFVIGCT